MSIIEEEGRVTCVELTDGRTEFQKYQRDQKSDVLWLPCIDCLPPEGLDD